MNNAVQLWDNHLSVITRPTPHVQSPRDVVVKIAYSAVSGTDLHVLEGRIDCAKSIILGHQFVGIVKEIGADVQHVSVGDRVVINPLTSCGICDFCLKGQPHLCKVEGKNTAIGIKRNGGWAQFCRLSAKNVIPLPHQVTFEQALFSEPMSCILRGWDLLVPLQTDAEVLICGAGNSGLLWASFLHFRGYREVVISEVLKGRQKIAHGLNFGFQLVTPDVLVSEARNAKQNDDQEWGFDVVVDCTGDPKCFEQSLQWLRQGGRLLLFGTCPRNANASINPNQLLQKELKIISYQGNSFTFTSGIQVLQDMGNHYLAFERLGVRTFQLQEYMAAIETMRSGEISKAVFEY
ncbi:predicted protein [Nematostella vectensis]|uniref:Uncharacterized protein n=1 Tax=Nematostella vectensis TaxID=45351 RepID=A7SKJ4_NEMVE|nr:D-arabinitol dehydrogenase 1 [Nematostella vectensis]EDO35781.1 predicted protein [Nematostella vectensis]|eukprot:XP_001627844.1 predicted protein [Nematostella vectensis]